jgi:CRP/FNR family cyclic AMP-dependent transcriptional regulator
MDRKLELLANVPLLGRLDRKALEAVARLCDEVDLPAGKVVVRQDTYGTEFYVVLDGALTVYRDGGHLADLGPGGFFGELALLAKIQRTATVTTTAPSRLLVLGAREFQTLLHDHPSIQEAILHAVAERMARLDSEHHTH